MSKVVIFFLLFIIIGDIYFREVLQWIWLILGGLLVLFLIFFHATDNEKKYKKH